MRNSEPELSLRQPSYPSGRIFVVHWDGKRRKFVVRDEQGHVLAEAPHRRPVLEKALLGANLASCFGVPAAVMLADQAGQMHPAFIARPRLRA